MLCCLVILLWVFVGFALGVGYFVSLLVIGILLSWCGGWVAFDLRLGCDLLRQLVLFGVSLRSSRMFGTCGLLGVGWI